MNAPALLLGALALAVSSAVGSANGAAAGEGEAKLTKLLHGRAAGTPTPCIDTRYRMAGGGLQVIDGVGLVYDAGKTVYLARATDPQALRWTDRLESTRAVSTRLCVSDHFWTRDRATGAQTGVVFLKDFVPYTKAG